jgi:hypothetical protein
MQEFPDGGFWKGKNYTFDKREAFGIEDPAGVGGVMTKDQRKAQKTAISKCCRCKKNWDRYAGKRKCYTCGVPVILCDSCLSIKLVTPEENLTVRCPLCTDQGITVAADNIEYIDNGKAATLKTAETEGKAAQTVMKSGGGFGKKKRENKLNKKECKFGAKCSRPNCFFSHSN